MRSLQPVQRVSLLTRRRKRTWIFVAATVLWVAVVLGALADAPRGERVTAAVVDGLVVGLPMAVGLLAWNALPDDRFARLLVAVGASFALTALSQSPDSVPYSVGRVAVWLVEPAVIYLMLVFPSGRITTSRERRLLAAIGILVGALYLPTALISEQFPVPSPWTTCGVDCPDNAFALVHVDSNILDGVRVLREVLTVAAVAAVAALLAGRVRRSGSLRRRALTPVVVVAVFQVLAFTVYQWTRRNGEVSDVVDVIGVVWRLTVPAVALSFAAGLLHRRLYVASALKRLTWSLRAPASSDELRRSLAAALEDPGLRVIYWLSGEPGRWVDESGWPAKPPEGANDKAVTKVQADGRPIAAVIHDAALGPDSKLVEAATSHGLMVLENTRLIGELRASVQRLSESEERGSTAALDERRSIERDLHDGAQQRLLALRINLSLIAERMRDDAPDRATELEQLGRQVEMTIEDMRELAHARSPLLLGKVGLGTALRAEARVVPLAVSVDDGGVGRFSPEIERTVYFACMEAVQNAVKHARNASSVAITLSADRDLRFEVRDDGAGFDGVARDNGSGLSNIADRLASVGGSLTIDSTPDRGTRVAGTVPIE